MEDKKRMCKFLTMSTECDNDLNECGICVLCYPNGLLLDDKLDLCKYFEEEPNYYDNIKVINVNAIRNITDSFTKTLELISRNNIYECILSEDSSLDDALSIYSMELLIHSGIVRFFNKENKKIMEGTLTWKNSRSFYDVL